jgi:hypothetical protein
MKAMDDTALRLKIRKKMNEGLVFSNEYEFSTGLGISIVNPLDAGDEGKLERAFRIAKRSQEYPGIDKFIKVGLGQTLIICGSGPSLRKDIEWIRRMHLQGAVIGAVNTAHDFLFDNGIPVDIMYLTDSRQWVGDYFTPREETEYLVGSYCDQNVFDKLKDFKVSVVHNYQGDDNPDILADLCEIDPSHLIGGGSTTGLRFLRLANPNYMWFTETVLAGFDSCYSGDDLHVEAKKKNVKIEAMKITVGLSDPETRLKLIHRYVTNSPMFVQLEDAAHELGTLLNAQKEGRFPPEFRVNFIGRGLLPDWAALHHLHLDPNLRNKLLEESGHDGVHHEHIPDSIDWGVGFRRIDPKNPSFGTSELFHGVAS